MPPIQRSVLRPFSSFAEDAPKADERGRRFLALPGLSGIAGRLRFVIRRKFGWHSAPLGHITKPPG
jgi:hypothetical protein